MRDWRGIGTTGLLTAFALGVHGYHPFAEDGGVYGAGVKRLLDPGMYGARPAFVMERPGFSLYAPMVAGMVRVSHVPLEWMLLGLYLVSVWGTLYGGWMIASRVTASLAGRCGAVGLLACWLTLPIAGTSLMMADPYLTARSLTTALVLVAVAGALRGSWLMVGVALVGAGVMHPLMAAYGLGAVVVIVAVASWGWRGAAVLGAAAGLVAAVVQGMGPAESAEYLWVARTRYYWFLSEWHWYEWMGLVAPVLVLVWLGRRRLIGLIGRAFSPLSPPGASPQAGIDRAVGPEGRAHLAGPEGEAHSKADLMHARGDLVLARGGVVVGVIAAAIAVGFARIGYQTHLVARLQPLRCFQMVYLSMIILLGAWLGERVLRDKAWRWAAMLVVLGGMMFFVQRSIYPASAHVEWPGSAPRNEWVQAFLWVRANTPKDAVFAMNAHYIQADGEDAQCFRAIAERDALPDYSKDGGEASIMPSLTDAWVQGQAAQAGIEDESDREREGKLKGSGVGWVVLGVRSGTGWECPYGNGLVKVCRVP